MLKAEGDDAESESDNSEEGKNGEGASNRQITGRSLEDLRKLSFDDIYKKSSRRGRVGL